jgi:hypothetical protein
VLRTLLEDRAEARLQAAQNFGCFGAAFTEAKCALLAPLPSPGFLTMAEGLIARHRELWLTAYGCRFDIDPRSFDSVCVLTTLLPCAYVRLG